MSNALNSKDLYYISGILRFTEKQILLNTGKSVTLELHRECKEAKTHKQLLMTEVSKYTRVSLADLRSKSTKADVFHVRVIISALIKQFYPRTSLAEIGEIMGGRDHSTIINQLNQFHDLMADNESFAHQYKKVKTHIELWLQQQ